MNKHTTKAWHCALLAIATLTFAAQANAVNLISDDRVVQTFFDGGNSTTTPDAPFADFIVSYQSTVVSESAFSGTGSGYGESDFSFFIAESTFDVTFSADNPVDLLLSGSYNASAGDFGFAGVSVELYRGTEIDVSQRIYEASIGADFDTVFEKFDLETELTADTYRLVIETNITPGGFGTEAFYNFSANFTDLPIDDDGDGVDAAIDNCTLVTNPDQIDTDGDGYGNACDPDFNNDCIVNFLDIGLFSPEFLGTNLLFDLNSSGEVNFRDYVRLSNHFLSPPGPSGLSDGMCQ